MKTKTIIEVDQDELYSAIESIVDSRLSAINEDLWYARFSGERVRSPSACDILKISAQTLSNWVRADKIRPLNIGSSKYEFRLSDILRLRLSKINSKNKQT
ncbi:MAG: helix-turn-helix domain-containing protein [Bacteroidales bacterium]|jgi:hypothetical protein|nr:helix-turn-helix domain-containing protein [Bacteroidales bacterium]